MYDFGIHDATNFRRSFKRWTGQTPGAAAGCVARVSGAAKWRPPADLKLASGCVEVDNLASPAAILQFIYASTRL